MLMFPPPPTPHLAFSQVNWQKADALDPSTYAHLLPGTSAVVHTLGVLLESTHGGGGNYKDAVRSGNPLSLAGALLQNAFASVGSRNPLEEDGDEGEGEYERINRDSGELLAPQPNSLVPRRSLQVVSVYVCMCMCTPALTVCEAFKNSLPQTTSPKRRPFIYISAEDIFRPAIPARYIASKRAAERGISRLLQNQDRAASVRAVFVRPSQY